MRFVLMVIRLAGVAVVVLYYRYMMKLGSWRMDYWYVTEWGVRTLTATRRGVNRMRVWLWSQLTYVPNATVKSAWAYLRERYHSGSFGALGT